MQLGDLRQLAERSGLEIFHECRDEGFNAGRCEAGNSRSYSVQARQIMPEQGETSLVAWQKPSENSQTLD